MKYNTTASNPADYERLWLEENALFGEPTYSDTSANIHKNEIRRFSNLYRSNIAEEYAGQDHEQRNSNTLKAFG